MSAAVAIANASFATLIALSLFNCNVKLFISFGNCINLAWRSVSSIGNIAFQGCTLLTSITIPGSVSSIGLQAFQSSGLTTVTIANNQLPSITSPTANPPGVAFYGVTVATI